MPNSVSVQKDTRSVVVSVNLYAFDVICVASGDST